MIDLSGDLKKFEGKDFEYFFKFVKLEDNFNDLWRMKAIARESLKEWLVSAHINVGVAENCANACSELIENCIKFTIIDKSSFILIDIVGEDIKIETVNWTEHEKKLELIEFIEGISKPDTDIQELYVERVRESILSEKSQLGLIKILMETKGKIQILRKEDDECVHLLLQINAKDVAS